MAVHSGMRFDAYLREAARSSLTPAAIFVASTSRSHVRHTVLAPAAKYVAKLGGAG